MTTEEKSQKWFKYLNFSKKQTRLIEELLKLKGKAVMAIQQGNVEVLGELNPTILKLDDERMSLDADLRLIERELEINYCHAIKN